MGNFSYDLKDNIDRTVESINIFSNFRYYYLNNIDWRIKVNNMYTEFLEDKSKNLNINKRKKDGLVETNSFNVNEYYLYAAEEVYRKKLFNAKIQLKSCLVNSNARNISGESNMRTSKIY